MTDYHHTKFGLIWSKESKVTEGGQNPPPQVENVLNRPGEIGLRISESVRAYVYLILSSQASSRPSIVGNSASSLTA